MANGTTRLALSKMQLNRSKATEENNVMKAISDKKSKMTKIPLKNPTSNNHSK